MWPSNSAVDSLHRPRLAVIAVSIIAAASVGYLAIQSRQASEDSTVPAGARLHRSNAVRRPRTHTHSAPSSAAQEGSDPRETRSEHDPTDAAAGDARAGAAADAASAETGTDTDTQGMGEGMNDAYWQHATAFPDRQPAGHNIVNLLFRISEDNARKNGLVHRGCQCNACGMVPIRGIRYRCINCADFDLCETCEAQALHIKTHIFYKIKIPAPPFGPRQMQPVWYTGDPDSQPRNLPRRLLQRLSHETGFDRPEIEASWEQWTYMANTDWREDPDGLHLAMDRRTFERCLIPTGGSRHTAPNLIHDRMFAFYDTNNDGLIGFPEFLHALSYRNRRDKLHRVFEGHDVDGDGFVDRRDFLRMFRAYYALYRQMHGAMIDALEDQKLASKEVHQLVTGRQPLSSYFGGQETRLPAAADSSARLEGKIRHPDGRVEVLEGSSRAYVADRPDTADRTEMLSRLFSRGPVVKNPADSPAGGDGNDDDDDDDGDTYWLDVLKLKGIERERAYWSMLLDPPTHLSQLPQRLSRATEEAAAELAERDGRTTGAVAGEKATDFSERASSRLESIMRETRQDRDRVREWVLRGKLYDRWRARQFYLDEEEGGTAPHGWSDDKDSMARLNKAVEAARAAAASRAARGSSRSRSRSRSRSSSRVRFAENWKEREDRSNVSSSPPSLSERWGGMTIPDDEKDAGLEILYQVTQQAFNELLDALFSQVEAVALEAAETKEERERWRALLQPFGLWAGEFDENNPDTPEAKAKVAAQHEAIRSGRLHAVDPGGGDAAADEARGSEQEPPATKERSLEELLAESGYTVVTREPRRPESPNRPNYGDAYTTDEGGLDEHRCPVLPQFRPNWEAASATGSQHQSSSSDAKSGEKRIPATKRGKSPSPRQPPHTEEPRVMRPPERVLETFKRLDAAEAQAMERGGWGRLNFEEFKAIYEQQAEAGNRLDYLGSWIDFCIP